MPGRLELIPVRPQLRHPLYHSWRRAEVQKVHEISERIQVTQEPRTGLGWEPSLSDPKAWIISAQYLADDGLQILEGKNFTSVLNMYRFFVLCHFPLKELCIIAIGIAFTFYSPSLTANCIAFICIRYFKEARNYEKHLEVCV